MNSADSSSAAEGAASPERGRAVRALSLMSGGLDSQLAVCVLREQGIHVEAVVFASPFFDIAAARRAAAALDVPLHIVDFTDDILAFVKSERPPHGFGSNLNPCIDCHARMIERAGEMVRAWGFDFVATGEVVGQRPMSQRRQSLDVVAKFSKSRDFLLRPLSAQLLDPTPMELDGRVDRSRLLGLSGRNRKPQMALAEKYGLVEYPSPAGGCLLTEPSFCHRLLDLKRNEGLDDIRLVKLLRLGRHLRLPEGARAVAGRNKADNEAIRAAAAPEDLVVRCAEIPGPSILLLAGASDADRLACMRVCASYADNKGAQDVLVRCHRPGAPYIEACVAPMPRDEFRGWIL